MRKFSILGAAFFTAISLIHFDGRVLQSFNFLKGERSPGVTQKGASSFLCEQMAMSLIRQHETDGARESLAAHRCCPVSYYTALDHYALSGGEPGGAHEQDAHGQGGGRRRGKKRVGLGAQSVPWHAQARGKCRSLIRGTRRCWLRLMTCDYFAVFQELGIVV